LQIGLQAPRGQLANVLTTIYHGNSRMLLAFI
jgi:hypothetical protein